MGNVNSAITGICAKCKFYFDSWLIYDEVSYCKKDNQSHMFVDKCSEFVKRKNLIDLLKILFYRFILGFQEEEERQKNPEWVKFVNDINELGNKKYIVNYKGECEL